MKQLSLTYITNIGFGRGVNTAVNVKNILLDLLLLSYQTTNIKHLNPYKTLVLASNY